MALPTTQSSSQPNTTTPVPSRASDLCYLLLSSAAALLPLRLSWFPAGDMLPYQLPCLCSRSICLLQLFRTAVSRSYRRVVRSLPSFCVMLLYFVSTSILGFLFLKLLAPAAGTPRVPSDLDLFFMAVSAVTVSSMSTAEMGALSTGQFVVLAILMLVGGEVFTSMAELQLPVTELSVEVSTPVDGGSPAADPSAGGSSTVATVLADGNLVELGLAAAATAASGDLNLAKSNEQRLRKYESLKTLGGVVFVYLVLAHVAGSMAILLYLIFNPGPRRLLAERRVSALGFSVFMTISSFANAGFVPLNEGMAPFKQSPGALLLIVPLVLAGNTLFPPLLRWSVRLSKAVGAGGELSEYILENSGEIGFQHLLSSRRSSCLLFTVAGFVCLQVVAFCWMEWGGAALEGLSAYQKVVGGLYMAVNSRHAGESPFDLSAVSSAVLVLYVVMMYLPPYTSFVPAMEDLDESSCCHDDDQGGGEVDGETLKRGQPEKVRGWKLVLGAVVESLSMSHLSYLAICIMLICITERRKLVHDPLNFNVLYVVVEVISAYGNVGFSTGYSCSRRLKVQEYYGGGGECEDASYGFVGWWSGGGKWILIVVMFSGRLKKYTMGGGEGWKLIS